MPGITKFILRDMDLLPLTGVWASPRRHLTEMPHLLSKGFDGWWELMQYLVGWVPWGGYNYVTRQQGTNWSVKTCNDRVWAKTCDMTFR